MTAKKNVYCVGVKTIDCLDVLYMHQRNVVATKANLKLLFSFRTRSFMEI